MGKWNFYQFLIVLFPSTFQWAFTLKKLEPVFELYCFIRKEVLKILACCILNIVHYSKINNK